MRYCLVSRFQASCLGSIIGESLSNPNDLSEELKIKQYEPKTWLKHRESAAFSLIETQNLPPEVFNSLAPEEYVGRSDRAILLLLPLIIFYADDLPLFKQTVFQSNSYLNLQVENIEDILVWVYTVTLALREKLKINRLIEQIVSGVEIGQTSLIEKLKVVQNGLRQSKPLNKVVKELSGLGNPSQVAIALSLYCFASTPENFELAVRRAIQTKYQIQTTAALTGALAGTYNSLTGIPLNWRTYGNCNRAYRQAMFVATELFKTWSGICSPPNNNFRPSTAAFPRTIQPRSTLNIISQAEYQD
ncbi:MAG: hypothetical protein Tsb0014_10570 [Pleurocapsa sp.]